MRVQNLVRVLFLICVSTAAMARGQDVAVTPSHADGIYNVGEVVEWTIEWKGDSPPAWISYVLKKGGHVEVGKGSIELVSGIGKLQTTFDEPGTLLAVLTFKSTDGKEKTALGGATCEWRKIAVAAPRPDDFDAFWAEKIKELQAVPANPKLEAVDAKKEGVDYFKITMDNIRGTHIQGQLARPTKGNKFPALLIPQWAGVYPLDKSWATDRAAEGWLVLNIIAHDIPIDETADFYKKQDRGPLSAYWNIGNDDRDKSYFLRMYLSCYRAVDYLSDRPDWDGKTVVVSGGSQGGMQSLMIAGLHPKITAALALCPAGCGMNDPDVGRDAGWPKWYWNTNGKDEKKVRDADRYYEIANFVPHISCPVLVGVGLIDQTCPPAGVIATFNQIPSAKELVILPIANHGDVNHSHAPYYTRWGAWMSELKQGKAPPIKP